jgi:hypothetical protein
MKTRAEIMRQHWEIRRAHQLAQKQASHDQRTAEALLIAQYFARLQGANK